MTRYISDYCTRETILAQLEKSDPGAGVPAPVTAEYNDLLAYVDPTIRAISNYITRITGHVFVPYKDTRLYYFNAIRETGEYDVYAGIPRLYLGEDLLVLSSVTWDSTLLSATYYNEYPPNRLPFTEIRFNPNTLPSWGTDFNDTIDVAGTWGYHDNTSQMYTQIDSSVTINSSSTSLTVADASLYQTYQYIKIEDELLQITARNETTDVLTVLRGVNGTTPAIHTTQPVSRFNVLDDIRIAATRLVTWAYNNRNDLGTQLTLPDGSVIENRVPAFVKETLKRFEKHVFGAV